MLTSIDVKFTFYNARLGLFSSLHFWRHFLVKHKILPNVVISNWLWWIMRVLLANQNGKYFEWIIRISNTLLGDPGTANMVFYQVTHYKQLCKFIRKCKRLDKKGFHPPRAVTCIWTPRWPLCRFLLFKDSIRVDLTSREKGRSVKYRNGSEPLLC